MHSLAMIQAEYALRLANERAEEYRRQAELERQWNRPRRSGLQAIAAAISGLTRRVAAGPADQAVTPTLSDYPYRA
jgi:hypothetical protein